MFKHYELAESEANQHVKYISAIFIMEVSFTFIGDFFNALLNLLMGNYYPETYYLSLSFYLPVDQSTYSGFVLKLLTQTIISISYGIGMTTVTSFFVSCCSYIEACFQFIRHQISLSDEYGAKKTKEKLRDIVQLHFKMIEYLTI